MSRTTRNHFAPALALVILATAGSIQPEFASAQSADQALLNQVPAVDFIAIDPANSIETGSTEVIGEIALLGRRQNPHTWNLQSSTGLLANVYDFAPIEGERALLGRWPVSQRQSMEYWAHRSSTPEVSSPATKVRTLSSRRDISSFTLGSRGAVKLSVRSDEARYGTITTANDRNTLVVISLGATNAEGSVTLTMAANQLLPNKRYAVGRYASALVVAGRPEHPTGAFHAEAGWVTITTVENGRIAGEFELLARGFLAADPQDENRWIEALGQFEGRGDSTALATVGLKPGA